MTPRVAVMQDGARLHYALPLALQRQGALDVMFTDWFVMAGSRNQALARLLRVVSPGLGQRMEGRQCPGLPPDQVAANAALALKVLLMRLRRDAPEVCEARVAEWMGAWVARRGWGEADCLMGFVRNSDPTLFAAAQAAGLLTVVDQIIAPAVVEHAALEVQAARWPAWAPAGPPAPARGVAALERRTWDAADHITCPSAYVQAGLRQQGVPPDKVSVLPYPIDASGWTVPDRSGRPGPVTVGFVGAVGLRKGAPVVFDIARRFDPARVRFVMVGPVQAPAAALASAGFVVLTGGVPRSAIAGHLHAFDLFLLPSACEGSAGAVMEAMASGLPVVTTPSAGTLVRDGVDGFVRNVADLDGLAGCVDWLAGDAGLRQAMGRAAREQAEALGIDAYGRSLVALLQSLREAHGNEGHTTAASAFPSPPRRHWREP